MNSYVKYRGIHDLDSFKQLAGQNAHLYMYYMNIFIYVSMQCTQNCVPNPYGYLIKTVQRSVGVYV